MWYFVPSLYHRVTRCYNGVGDGFKKAQIGIGYRCALYLICKMRMDIFRIFESREQPIKSQITKHNPSADSKNNGSALSLAGLGRGFNFFGKWYPALYQGLKAAAFIGAFQKFVSRFEECLILFAEAPGQILFCEK